MIEIRIGLPYASGGKLMDTARDLGGKILVSANAFFRRSRHTGRWYFGKVPDVIWSVDAALDSAGFTAMRLGGYRWTVAQYVEWVATRGGAGNENREFPWSWWAAMDYCCEPEIARNAQEVAWRVDATIKSYGKHLDCVKQQVENVPAPMPVIQGWRPADYVRCVRALLELAPSASLLGVGSVCRRDVHGPNGILRVLDALAGELPSHSALHLFGVKGAALEAALRRFGPGLVHSMDSMAWDVAARRERDPGQRSAVDHRAQVMRRWFQVQRNAVARWDAGGCAR